MHMVSDLNSMLLLLSVTGLALILYVMRRRVRLGKRIPKF